MAIVFWTSTICATEGQPSRQSFDRQHGLEETSALPAEFFGDFDTHESEFEHFFQKILAKDGRFVHGADMRSDALTGEAEHSLPERLVDLPKD